MAMKKTEGGKVVYNTTLPKLAGGGLFPVKLVDSVGALKQMQFFNKIYQGYLQQSAADGDVFIYGVWSNTGKETQMCVTTLQCPSCGLIDIYINGSLDSSGYDEYNAATTMSNRWITLTKPIRKGYNEIRFKINGKNALSTNYRAILTGMSIQ